MFGSISEFRRFESFDKMFQSKAFLLIHTAKNHNQRSIINDLQNFLLPKVQTT